MSVRYICPFCLGTIVEYDGVFYPLNEIEQKCFEHIKKRHPIKWRFNRKFRLAVKQYMSQMVR